MKVSQRQNQKNQTRALIVAVAMKQFSETGLLATRTSDISAAAKVSHGTIFAHFPTREALLEEVIETFGGEITRRLHELILDHGELKAALGAHLKGLSEHEAFYARLISEVNLLPESARNTVIMIQSAISFHLSQIAERDMELGKIIEMPLHLFFNTWIGLIHHYLSNAALFAPGASVLSKYSEQLTTHFMTLISSRGEVT